MYISRLAVDHFRSWEHCLVDFAPGVTILQGANGIGKTNLVEAIEVLSTGGSHRVSSSLPLIEHGSQSATIRANLHNTIAGDSEPDTYELTIRAKGANRARINQGQSLYMRDIVGRVPSVSFTPSDQRLVSGEPAQRRQLLDQACAMLIPGYPQQLQQFTHIAKQRAALLKQLGTDDGTPTGTLLASLEIWTGQYTQLAVPLTRARGEIVRRLAEPFARIHRQLAGTQGTIELSYMPSLAEAMHDDDPSSTISRHFQQLYAAERARGTNLIGPQRDDLLLLADGMPAREFASNGEMWTMALALKMALFELLDESKDSSPIVILDDVFAQLDESRRRQILAFAQPRQQVIITVAAASDIPDVTDAQLIDVARLRAERAVPHVANSIELP